MDTVPISMGLFPARDGLVSGRFNPDMLVIAREAQFLTQSGLAEKLCVSQPLVGKWEANLSLPSEDQLKALSAILQVQVAFFFMDRPRRLASMSDFYHRALAKAKRIDMKAIHARCCIIDMQLDRLLEASEPQDDRTPIPDINPENHAGDIDKVAAMARVAMGVPPGPIANLVQVIEACGGFIVDRELEVEDVDALCRWVPGLPKLFFINGSRPADRIRFSLAHELGHTIMHFGRDFNQQMAEDQANRFASSFLMPAHDIRRDFTKPLHLPDLASLKRKWRVSMQAIIRRAFDIKMIDATRYASLNVAISRNGWKKTEPVEIARESPHKFARLIKLHVERGYSLSDLASLLFVSEATVNQMLVDNESPNWDTDGIRMRIAR